MISSMILCHFSLLMSELDLFGANSKFAVEVKDDSLVKIDASSGQAVAIKPGETTVSCCLLVSWSC